MSRLFCLILLFLSACAPATEPQEAPPELAALTITSEGQIHAFTLRSPHFISWTRFVVVGPELTVNPDLEHTVHNGALVVTETDVGHGYALYVDSPGRVCANVVFTFRGSEEQFFLEGCSE
jgi:beta-lactamase superfamily II metal-dependent hydrolase